MTTPISEYSLIPLTMGQFAIVDASDYERISALKWYAHYSAKTKSFYAANRSVKNGKKVTTYMHREVLGLTAGDKRQADHIRSGDTLDNRRSNLRISTHAENARNKRMMKNNKSGAKGVCYKKRRGIWEANICVDRKQIYLGTFYSLESAKSAYDEAAKRLHREFARLS